MSLEPLPISMARLIADPRFQRFWNIQNVPNFFQAVGRTFTETWHSRFLGWLLDPQGSHGLSGFPLKQFLVSTSHVALAPDEESAEWATPSQLAHMALMGDSEAATVLPNERARQERSIGESKFDVWIEIPVDDEAAPGAEAATPKQNFVLVEMKVNASLSKNQATKYADYVEAKARAEGGLGACIFLARTEDIGDSSQETVDDDRWYCFDFQALHDHVLLPCLEHPKLNPQMRPLVQHYIFNLRAHGTKGRLAVTDEERNLALGLLERYEDTFRALADVLQEEENFPEGLAVALTPEKTKDPLRIECNGETLVGEKVPSFFKAVFDYAFKRKPGVLSLPYATGKKRYLLAEAPVHPSGSSFVSPKEYQHGERTLFFEANVSRKQAVAHAIKFLNSLGLEAIPT